ncbi:MAG: PQQ-like beta-propeller repeat protein [Candidatus Thermoplasmatota archaeon]|nr:PQQ-like beta-propeller repeat protein [Candidatus Thermoplasmatota archaeon]
MDKKIVLVVMLVVLSATVIPVAGFLPTQAGYSAQTHQLLDSETGVLGFNDDIWPMFRHDSANTGCTDYYSPNTNHVKWQTNINTQIGQTTPILYADKLYISTGWYYKSETMTNDLFNRTPLDLLQELLQPQTIDNSGLYCLDAKTGAYLWSLPMDSTNDPAIVDDNVYVTSMSLSSYTSELYCLNAKNGNISWKKDINGLVLSPTLVVDEKIFITSLDFYSYAGSMNCYDLSGELLWSSPFNGYELCYFSAPAVYDGRVYCMTIDLYSYFTGNLYCMNEDTGAILWTKPIYSFALLFGQSVSPVCADDKVYITDFDLYSYVGHLRCFDGETGDVEWTHTFTSSLIFASPAISEDLLYIPSFEFYSYYSWLYCFDATNGALQWKVALPGSDYFGFGSAICSADKILLSSGGYASSNELMCLEKENGSFVWNYLLDSETIGRQSFGKDRLYATDVDGNVYMFEDVLKITYILGGFLGINAIIHNSDNTSLYNITWSISVTGGYLGNINRTHSGAIQELRAGKSKIIRLVPIIGMGKFEVLVKATMPMMNMIKKAKQGLVFGSICICLP